MTRAGRPKTARLAASCLFAASLLCPARLLSADSARTLALADFAVRAPGAQVAEFAWLGPALSELLQAKVQLFGGVRVLERTRVRTLLRDAKLGEAAATDDPAALGDVIPAEVLIAGSVNVDPRQPDRIRVRARAFETETARIVSETAFSADITLAGLLTAAEDLARTLADGLKLSYSPDQLAYAEPARIDTLKHFVAGEGHLAAARHREAIAAFQQALDGNGGRYYAAAHRLQGEAYQALANSTTGKEERAVRDEYVKKFKEDALLASASLFDLGLAYESNEMWTEALRAFGDYVTAVGTAGEAVRWRADLGPDLDIRREPDFFLESGDRLHLFVDSRWIVLNPATGGVLGNRSLVEVLGLVPDPEAHRRFHLAAWRERSSISSGGRAAAAHRANTPTTAGRQPSARI